MVLAGGDLWLDKEIKTVISRLKLDREIEMRGFVPREDLPALYSGAKAFISPSLYEGFGLPILEAFACGTPVITGNTGSMPEVAGEAAFLIDPFDTEEISQALVKMDRDGDLVLQLRKKGRERVKKFSWEKTAEKLLDIMIYVICHPDENRDPYK